MNCKQCRKTHIIEIDPTYELKYWICEGKKYWANIFRTKKYKQKCTVMQNVNAIDEMANSDIFYIGKMKSIDELDIKESGSAGIKKNNN